MIILNTTFLVHKTIESQFIDWVHQTYLPTAQQSGIFTDPVFSRVLLETDPEGTSYAIQLQAKSHTDATQWHESEAALLKNALAQKWGEKVLHFSTFMEILNK